RFVAEEYALRTADHVLAELDLLIPDSILLAEALADTLPAGTAADWVDAMLHGWATSCIDSLEVSDPALLSLDQPAPLGGAEQASARLLELHQQIASEEALRLAANGDRRGLMAVNPAELRARRTPEQTVRENLLR